MAKGASFSPKKLSLGLSKLRRAREIKDTRISRSSPSSLDRRSLKTAKKKQNDNLRKNTKTRLRLDKF